MNAQVKQLRAAKDKATLMAAMRERRQREGWVQVNVWVRRQNVDKLRRCVKRLGVSATTPQEDSK